jgi:predicted amidophosphoribosyltransferase
MDLFLKVLKIIDFHSDCLLCKKKVPFFPKNSNQSFKNTHSSSYQICHTCHTRLPLIKLVCWICGLPCSQEGTPCGQCLQNSP